MDKLFGFIGTGNMGGALAQAASKSVQAEQLLLSDHDSEKARALAKRLNAKCADNAQIANQADYIFIGVKPQMLSDLACELSPLLQARKTPFVLVSMAAGVKIEKLRALFGPAPIIRIMPNIPCRANEGAVLYAACDVSDEALNTFLSAMSAAGRLLPMDEKLFDAGTAVSGCGPAYAFMFIEALADGGVACGLSRKNALTLAAQTLLGSAKLFLEGDTHPEQLKDDVCSPAGSTIQGVRALEKNNFRSALIEAVIAAYESTKKLG